MHNLATVVSMILSKKFGGRIQLDKSENILPQRLYRFRLLSGPRGAPASVFVKRKRARKIRIEWACLQFLSEEMGEHCTVPSFYGGGYTGKNNTTLIVMEDMGDGKNLSRILAGDDRQNAELALLEFATALGKINAYSIGRMDRFHQIRNSVVPIRERSQDLYCIYAWKLKEICDATGIKPYPECFSELKYLVGFLDASNRFHGLTHGDLYPVNVYQSTSKSKVYIFDYEFGNFQHVLVDGFQIRVYLDMWAEVSRFPDSVVRKIESAYRSALSMGCSEAQDDEWFYRRVIEACLHETICCIYRFSESPRAVFSNTLNSMVAGDYNALKTDPNYNHWGLPAIRRRVLYRLGILAQLTEERGYLLPLGATARNIHNKFRSVWPSVVHEMPLYSAFR